MYKDYVILHLHAHNVNINKKVVNFQLEIVCYLYCMLFILYAIFIVCYAGYFLSYIEKVFVKYFLKIRRFYLFLFGFYASRAESYNL